MVDDDPADGTITLEPIGTVTSPRTEKRDDHWGDVVAEIELADRFTPDALAGLETFSHVEVIFYMHRVRAAGIEDGARHPRNNTEWPELGIFAQRAKGRPNRLGLSRCAVIAVEGRRLRVRALDAIDGTPVLDIKPYMREFGPRGTVTQPVWVGELMAEYYD
ncbi:MAG: tRNA (N6-threonylcarbamoyladenosine(37)-N6)-methyltransferase TrmO [Halobacteriales archaeon]|nr:tRNA (N6-threonylcarbamoyladenosine(37)-N6)-methyltransferase TrmO [Halobacteriales archaeon]